MWGGEAGLVSVHFSEHVAGKDRSVHSELRSSDKWMPGPVPGTWELNLGICGQHFKPYSQTSNLFSI